MTRTWYKTLTALLWLAPAVVAIRYWQVWDQLPLRMATHFDAAGHANGWMTREVSLYYALGFLAFLLAVFTFVLVLVTTKYSLSTIAWALLAFFHAEVWSAVCLLNSIVDYNLTGQQVSVVPILFITPIGVLVLFVLALAEKRGSSFPDTDVIAEEVHAGKPFSLFMVLPLLGGITVALSVPNAGTRLAAVLLGTVFIAAFGMAWDGFHYLFTRHGVEIRTLGFRLKSIPLMQIKRYEIGDWSLPRGYGIRGIGNRKAYVWGNRGVRVEMYDGEIFLGHSDPQRIVHDLNVIKQYQHS